MTDTRQKSLRILVSGTIQEAHRLAQTHVSPIIHFALKNAEYANSPLRSVNSLLRILYQLFHFGTDFLESFTVLPLPENLCITVRINLATFVGFIFLRRATNMMIVLNVNMNHPGQIVGSANQQPSIVFVPVLHRERY